MKTITVLFDCGHEKEIQVKTEDMRQFYPLHTRANEPKRYMYCSPTKCDACRKEEVDDA